MNPRRYRRYVIEVGGVNGDPPEYLTNLDTLQTERIDQTDPHTTRFKTALGAEQAAEQIRKTGLHAVVRLLSTRSKNAAC